MAKRPCTRPGCPNLSDRAGYCTACARARDRARGTRQQRGYGKAHDDTRKAGLTAAYGTQCARCPELMLPGQPLHLDHNARRDGYLGFSHAACNLSAAGKAAHR